MKIHIFKQIDFIPSQINTITSTDDYLVLFRSNCTIELLNLYTFSTVLVYDIQYQVIRSVSFRGVVYCITECSDVLCIEVCDYNIMRGVYNIKDSGVYSGVDNRKGVDEDLHKDYEDIHKDYNINNDNNIINDNKNYSNNINCNVDNINNTINTSIYNTNNKIHISNLKYLSLNTIKIGYSLTDIKIFNTSLYVTTYNGFLLEIIDKEIKIKFQVSDNLSCVCFSNENVVLGGRGKIYVLDSGFKLVGEMCVDGNNIEKNNNKDLIYGDGNSGCELDNGNNRMDSNNINIYNNNINNINDSNNNIYSTSTNNNINNMYSNNNSNNNNTNISNNTNINNNTSTSHTTSITTITNIEHIHSTLFLLSTSTGTIHYINTTLLSTLQQIKIRTSPLNDIKYNKTSFFTSGEDSRLIQYKLINNLFKKVTQIDLHYGITKCLYINNDRIFVGNSDGIMSVVVPCKGKLQFVRVYDRNICICVCKNVVCICCGDSINLYELIDCCVENGSVLCREGVVKKELIGGDLEKKELIGGDLKKSVNDVGMDLDKELIDGVIDVGIDLEKRDVDNINNSTANNKIFNVSSNNKDNASSNNKDNASSNNKILNPTTKNYIHIPITNTTVSLKKSYFKDILIRNIPYKNVLKFIPPRYITSCDMNKNILVFSDNKSTKLIDLYPYVKINKYFKFGSVNKVEVSDKLIRLCGEKCVEINSENYDEYVVKCGEGVDCDSDRVGIDCGVCEGSVLLCDVDGNNGVVINSINNVKDINSYNNIESINNNNIESIKNNNIESIKNNQSINNIHYNNNIHSQSINNTHSTNNNETLSIKIIDLKNGTYLTQQKSFNLYKKYNFYKNNQLIKQLETMDIITKILEYKNDLWYSTQSYIYNLTTNKRYEFGAVIYDIKVVNCNLVVFKSDWKSVCERMKCRRGVVKKKYGNK